MRQHGQLPPPSHVSSTAKASPQVAALDAAAGSVPKETGGSAAVAGGGAGGGKEVTAESIRERIAERKAGGAGV